MRPLNYIVLVILPIVVTLELTNDTQNGFALVKKVYSQCEKEKDLSKCLKLQALKIADRALKSKSLEILDGISLVQSKSVNRGSRFINHDLEHLNDVDENKIDNVLLDAANNFLETRVVSISLPKLMQTGRGRRNRWHGPFLALLAVKGMFMAMAYKSIAAMAGAALIIGKMALVLTAVLGLKKLISGSAHGKSAS